MNIKTLVAAAALAALSFVASPAAAIVPGGTVADPVIVQQVAGLGTVVSVSSNVATTGFNRIVAASGSLAYAILSYSISCTNVNTTAVAFAQTNNALANLITSTKTISANGGLASLGYNPFAVAASSAGASLGINLNNDGPCGVDLTYITR